MTSVYRPDAVISVVQTLIDMILAHFLKQSTAYRQIGSVFPQMWLAVPSLILG